LFNLNTGAGVQTGPILNPETDIPDNYVPSIRTSFQAAQWTARVALQTTPTAEAAPAAAAAPVAAAAGELPAVAVPESPATVADDPVGADPVSDITVAAEPAPAAESAPPAETADSADVEADAVKDVTPKRKATKRDGSHRAAARGGNGS
jgi:hypothetical protein